MGRILVRHEGLAGQFYNEPRRISRAALRPDATLMGIDDPPRDVEAETGPGHRAGAAATNLSKMRSTWSGSIRSVVLDDEASHVLGLLQGDLDGHLRGCVLAGVVEEVREDLLDAVRIAVQHHRGIGHREHHATGHAAAERVHCRRTSSARSIGCRT